MSTIVRSFHRSDREQLAALVNAHIAAVIPGVTVSVNTVLSVLERDPGEFIVDPWVRERVTLVAEQRGRLLAAAHLLRFGDEPEVGESYRGIGEIHWFLFRAEGPYWPDSAQARDALMSACLRQLEQWSVARQYADGTLPAPAVYGVPDQWPHVAAVFERAGFVHEGQTEIVYLAGIDDLPTPSPDPLPNLRVTRSVGINGTRLAAVQGDQVLGYIEVEARQDASRVPRQGDLADVGNLEIAEAYRRCGIGTWLMAQAADWLRSGGVVRLLDYARPDERERIAFLRAVGFRELTRTRRGWARTPQAGAADPLESARP